MKGNRIILTPDRGFKVEGFLNSGETVYPGMVVQIDPTQTVQGGRQAWKIYSRSADGNRPKGPYIILTEDIEQGKSATDAYATTTGTRLFGFVPAAGCELNLLHYNVAGTADDVAAGDLLIPINTVGKFSSTTGSPQSEPAQALEADTDPTADHLLWSIWTGH